MKKLILLFSLVLTSSLTYAQSYCTDGGPSSNFDSNVQQVDLVGETNTIVYTGCTNGGNGVSGVEDQTALSADLIAGNTYTLDIQFGTCGGNFGSAGEAWIDFNQDFIFQPGESVGTITGTPPLALSSFSFTVPADAINGASRLRVMQFEGGVLPLNPCASFTWGSVVDFEINISGGIDLLCQIPFNLAFVDALAGTADFTWDAEPNATNGYVWEVYNQGDDPETDAAVSSGTFAAGSISGTVSGLTELSDYDFYLASDCGPDGLSDLNGPVSFSTIASCPLPDNISLDAVLSDSVVVNWDEVVNASNGYNWLVFNDGEDPEVDTPLFSGNVPFGSTSVTISGLSPNTDYDVYLVSDCDTDGTSSFSGALGFTTLCAPFVAPFFEDFNASTAIPACWTQGNANGEDWEFGLGETYTFIPTGGESPSAGNNAHIDDSAPDSQGTTLLTPLVDVSGLITPAFSFYWTSGDLGIYLPVDFTVDVWDGTAWNNVFTRTSASGTITNGFEEVIIDISTLTITGPVQARFVVDEVEAGDFQDDLAIDDVSFDEAPACLTPTGLAVSNVTENTIDISWNGITNATAGYIWSIFNPGEDPLTDAPIFTGTAAAGATTTTITGLNPSTDYTVFIQSDCGATNGLSDFSGGINFQTLCSVFVAPYIEDFNADPSSIPNCWNQGANNNENWLFTDTPPAFGHIGNNGVLNSSTASGGGFAWVDDSFAHSIDTRLESPFIDISGLSVPAISFYFVSNNEGESNVDFRVEVWDGAAWNEVFFSNQNSANGEWELVIVDISTLTFTDNIQLAFIVDENNGNDFDDDLAIDDIAVIEAPNCLPPSGVSFSNITEDSVDVSWSGVSNAVSGYDWELYFADADPTTDTPEQNGNVPSGTTTLNLTALTDGTDYDFYILSNCDADGTSDTVGPFSFQTLFLPPTNDNICDAIPLTVGVIPPGDTYTNFAATAEPNEPEGSCFDSGINGSVWFTFVAPDSGEVEVSTDIAGGTLTDTELAVYEAPTDCTDASTLGAQLGCDQDGGVVVAFNSIVNLTGLTPGTTYYVQVDQWGTAQPGSFGISVLDTNPPCPAPENVSFVSSTTTTADFSWDDVAEETDGYNWFVFNNGDDPNTAASVVTGSVGADVTTVTVTGLLASSTYDFYVVANCGATDGLSILSDGITFSTQCTVFAAPFLEDFDGSGWVSGTGFGNTGDAINNCWSRNPVSPNYFWGTRTGTTGTGATGPDAANSGVNYVFAESSNGGAGAEALFFSPLIDVSTLNSPALFFWYHMAGATTGTLSVDVSAGSGFDLDVFTISGPQQTGTADPFIEQIVDLSAYSGQTIQLRFRAVRGTGFTGDIAIDDVSVDEAPSCLKPVNLSSVEVFYDSIEISWSPVGNATSGYIWEVYNAGDDPDVSTPVSTGTFPAGTTQGVADGLTPLTDYDIYIASDCGPVDGQSDLLGPVSFTTTELCSVPTTFTVDNVLPNQAELNWSAIPNATGYQWAIFFAGDDPLSATPEFSGTAAATENNVTVVGLTDNTAYEAYVTTDCGSDGLSFLSNPVPFITPCLAFAAPYTEDFDGGSWTSGAGFNNAGDVIDNCWSRNPDNGFFWGTRTGTTGTGGTGPSSANSGPNYVYTEGSGGANGSEAFLVTPFIDLSTLNTPALFFFYHMFGPNIGELNVDVNNGSGFDLGVFTLIGEQQTSEDDPWIEQIVDLSAYSGQTIQIRFRGVKGTGFTSDIAIDDVEVDEAPTCFDPTNLEVLAVTDVTADLTWQAGAGETVFDVEIVLSGSAQTGVPTFENVTLPFTADGLSAETEYEFYVRADCGPGDVSDWVGPVEFKTQFTPTTVIVNAPAVNDTYCYDNNQVKEWLFVSSDGTTPVEINFNAGSIEDDPDSQDRCRIFNGFDANAPVLYDTDVDGVDMTGVQLIADSGAAYILLESDIFGSCQGGIVPLEELDFDVFAGTPSTDTANVQIIHNSADPLAQNVDIYVNGNLEFADVAFRTATPFVELGAGFPINIDIAPAGSTDVSESIYNLNTTLTTNETYVVVANGVLDPSQFDSSVNSPIAFNLDVFEGAQQTSTNAGETSILIHHGATDAPTVDVIETSVPAGTLAEDISYTQFQGYVDVPTADYILNVELGDNSVVVATYEANLATLGTGDLALTVLASGFLDPTANQGGAEFGLWAALPTGGALIELPELFISTSAFDESNFSFYPNPVKSILTINSVNPVSSIQIFDVLGRQVFERDFEETNPSLLLDELSSGTYLMKVKIGEFSEIFRFIKE